MDTWALALAAIVVAAILCGIAYRIPARRPLGPRRLRGRENGRER